MKLDILALTAHPDDAELSCGGVLIKWAAEGRKTGVVDLTRGELGTRGNAETRKAEAEKASQILGLAVRENLEMKDGFFRNDEEHQRKIIQVLRRFQPEIVLTNAPMDRHPDHGRAAALVKDAAFLSGLLKIETEWNGQRQAPWRPRQVYHIIQDQYLTPSFVVDVSPYFDQKIEAVKAYATQFFTADSEEPETYISRKNYLDMLAARGRVLGHTIGVEYGEGFISNTMISLDNLFSQTNRAV